MSYFTFFLFYFFIKNGVRDLNHGPLSPQCVLMPVRLSSFYHILYYLNYIPFEFYFLSQLSSQKVDYPLELDVFDLCSDDLRKQLEAPRLV